jgi:hypothetical protein
MSEITGTLGGNFDYAEYERLCLEDKLALMVGAAQGLQAQRDGLAAERDTLRAQVERLRDVTQRLMDDDIHWNYGRGEWSEDVPAILAEIPAQSVAHIEAAALRRVALEFKQYRTEQAGAVNAVAYMRREADRLERD